MRRCADRAADAADRRRPRGLSCLGPDLLELEGFKVIGLAEDGEAAIQAVAHLHPEVVLLDVQLPGMDGFEVARRLAADTDGPQVVLISSRDRSAYTAQLRDAQVSGFLGKGELSGAALHALVA